MAEKIKEKFRCINTVESVFDQFNSFRLKVQYELGREMTMSEMVSYLLEKVKIEEVKEVLK